MLKGSWILKIAALVFAILTYVYVHAEVRKEENKTLDPSYKLIKLTTKTLPINVRVGTAPPDGYQVSLDQIVAKPAQITVIAPEGFLETASTIETAMIDVSESIKTVVKKIPLEGISGLSLSGEPYVIEVTIPIEKIPTKAV